MKLDQDQMTKALEWAYDKALEDGVVMDGAIKLASEYKANGGTPLEQANDLIRWQSTKTFTSGFITGFGGLPALIVMLPTDLTAVLFIQLRMIASIAYLAGFDIENKQVRTIAYACLMASSCDQLISNINSGVNTQSANAFIEQPIEESVLSQINQAISTKILAKFGQNGIINISKAVPVIGGIVSGTFNAMSTHTTGDYAVNIFIRDQKL